MKAGGPAKRNPHDAMNPIIKENNTEKITKALVVIFSATKERTCLKEVCRV
ncbi:Uncharacterised protein [Chlamydia trachomatis]|nr:Uncharacterised protein [Chlamydia trachomatis]